MRFKLISRSCHGISIIEVMLSIAIIAVILLMAIRYYTVANLSRQVNETSSDIDAVSTGAQAWWDDNNHSFSMLKDINVLINAGYLTSEYLTNVWGGKIQVAPTNNGTNLKIQILTIPQIACKNLSFKYAIQPVCTLDTSNNTTTFEICIDGAKNYFKCP